MVESCRLSRSPARDSSSPDRRSSRKGNPCRNSTCLSPSLRRGGAFCKRSDRPRRARRREHMPRAPVAPLWRAGHSRAPGDMLSSDPLPALRRPALSGKACRTEADTLRVLNRIRRDHPSRSLAFLLQNLVRVGVAANDVRRQEDDHFARRFRLLASVEQRPNHRQIAETSATLSRSGNVDSLLALDGQNLAVCGASDGCFHRPLIGTCRRHAHQHSAIPLDFRCHHKLDADRLILDRRRGEAVRLARGSGDDGELLTNEDAG